MMIISITTTNLNQMMENGNEPSAMEVLDEIFGHNFNLYETGLGKTFGHHLEVEYYGQKTMV